jgi:hypothetical protein
MGRNHFEDRRICMFRIILIWTLKKWSGFIWLRIGTSGGFL